MFLRSIITFLILILTLVNSYAQTDSASLRNIYDKEVIYFSGSNYVKNNTKFKVRNLEKEFTPNSEAFELYKSYRSDLRKSSYFGLVGVAISAIGIIVGDKNPAIGIGLVFVGGLGVGVSFGTGLRADRKMRKSVWLRNRDVLLQRN
jgi:hypothetical protein